MFRGHCAGRIKPARRGLSRGRPALSICTDTLLDMSLDNPQQRHRTPSVSIQIRDQAPLYLGKPDRHILPIPYAELHCISNYSFLRGASHPEELVQQASDLGYQAIAITDECSYSGLVKAHKTAKACGIKLICGAEFILQDLHPDYKNAPLHV